jgi:hypothetical protein
MPWAAMRFVMAAYKKTRRRAQLENLLLLFLRMAAVALLAFAISRPFAGDESPLAALTESLGSLADQMRSEQNVLIRLADSQAELRPLFSRIAELDMSTVNLDDNTRGHIRNLDIHMERLVGELSNGRDHTVQEIRSEIRLLARTIAAIAEETEAG